MPTHVCEHGNNITHLTFSSPMSCGAAPCVRAIVRRTSARGSRRRCLTERRHGHICLTLSGVERVSIADLCVTVPGWLPDGRKVNRWLGKKILLGENELAAF